MFDAPPEAFGSYRVVEAVGAGRFGPIYRAQDATGLFIAIKVFDQGLTSDQAARLALTLGQLREAPLNHPAIVPVLAAGTLDERAWTAEPWFDAVPLETLMQRHGSLPVRDALVCITQVAGALDFAAAVGIHHGALHPRDILVTADQTVLAGVGVLQALSNAGLAVPMQGAYVSPQRGQGLPVSRADDVFTLAAISYELVYGVPVPARAELRATDASAAGIDSGRFLDVVERAMSPEPADRPATALAFVEAVQSTIISAPAVPAPVVDPEIAVRASSHAEPEIPIRESSHPQPEIPIHVAAPQRPTPADLPLRAPEPVSVSKDSDERQRVASKPAPESSMRDREPESPPSLWFPISATLAIGLLMGFAGGYVAGQRDATPAPYAAERPVARNQPASGQDQPRANESSAPPAGRDFTESVVPVPRAADDTAPTRGEGPRTVTEQPVIPAPEPAEGTASRATRAEPGSLQVDSRPRGARVFIDGRLVGTTPVLVSDIIPGPHAVRIDLRGHRRWVTSVDVAPGERHRVAASLEQ